MLGLLNVLKVIAVMVTELTQWTMETNTLENGKKVNDTDKELSRGQAESLLETNTLGNGKMANKRHGKGTFTMEDGGTYVGTTKDGVPHGQGTYTWTS